MHILNERTEETSKRIHLMVTNLCSRHCPDCCNKCYSKKKLRTNNHFADADKMV